MYLSEWLYYLYWLKVLVHDLNKIWTVLELVNWGTDYFRKKGIDSPRLNIELLLCNLLNFDRIDLYLQYDKPLTKSELEKLRSMVLRRSEREPLQYITGLSEFCGRNFIINRNVLIPRPETEILVNEVFNKMQNSEAELIILDIGTGCGNIALSLALKFINAKIIAVDLSSDALTNAKANADIFRLNNVEFIKCDILKNLPDYGPFDVIVSNPPYISFAEYKELQPEVLNYEPASALTDKHDGMTFYRRFSQIFGKILKPRGLFFLEIGFEQSDRVQSLFSDNGFVIYIIPDFDNIPRVVVGSF